MLKCEVRGKAYKAVDGGSCTQCGKRCCQTCIGGSGEYCQDHDYEALLGDSMVWPEGLEALVSYSRLHDDHDGTFQGSIAVVIGPDGDAHVTVPGRRPCQSLRYRTSQGGGRSMRVRNALLILALAIKMDNEERPIQIPEAGK